MPKGTPIPPELRAFDPLAPSSPRGPSSWFEAVVLILGAALVHGAVVTALYAANAIVPRRALDVAKDEIVEMKIVEPPPPVEPEPLVKPEPEREEAAPQKPKAERQEEKKEPERAAERPKEREPKPDAPPPRRIAGLSFESTVSGGGGPSFAVGNTTKGVTGKTAVDPTLAAKTPEGDEAPRETVGNRKSTRIAPGGGTLVKPARKRLVKPDYPEAYRAQNLEADVVVELSLDETGKVVGVRIVSPSPHGDFNLAAEAAARREEFTPATRDGRALPFTLTFTYRFRLSE